MTDPQPPHQFRPTPPSYPSPRWTAPYPPPGQVARRRSRWLTIGLPVAVVLVLGGLGAGIWFLVGAVTGSLGPAMGTADDYSTALIDQRWSDAHDLLCERNQASISPEDLAAQYGDPAVTEFSIEAANVHSSGGVSTAQVEVVFTTENGFPERTTLPLIREGDNWRICL